MSTARTALERDGFAVVDGVTSCAFERLLADLGRIVLRTRVELREGVMSYLCRADPVPLHTDHPDVDLVAWRCEEQDAHAGSSLLVDGRAVLRRLQPLARDALRSVRLPCPTITQLTTRAISSSRPVLDGHDRIYFASWLRPCFHGPTEAWLALKHAVDNAAPLEVRLAPGQVLIVDNRRVLHGRRALPAASRRRLERAWIVRSA